MLGFCIFLLYTVEPCYKAPFWSQINVLWEFFPLLEEKWKLGGKKQWRIRTGKEGGSSVSWFAAPGWKSSRHLLPRCWGSDYSDAPLYFKT